MADIVDKATRSRMMSGIRGKDTKPEMIVRRALHSAGFRYRLHAKDLPGKPDIVLPKYRSLIFVHGCFWHGHNCHLFKMPSTRTEFWEDKIAGNVARDQKAYTSLANDNWRIGIIWECSLKGRERLEPAEILNALSSWLKSRNQTLEIKGRRR